MLSLQVSVLGVYMTTLPYDHIFQCLHFFNLEQGLLSFRVFAKVHCHWIFSVCTPTHDFVSTLYTFVFPIALPNSMKLKMICGTLPHSWGDV